MSQKTLRPLIAFSAKPRLPLRLITRTSAPSMRSMKPMARHSFPWNCC